MVAIPPEWAETWQPWATPSLFYISRQPRFTRRVRRRFALKGRKHGSPGQRPGAAICDRKKPCRAIHGGLRTAHEMKEPIGNDCQMSGPRLLRPFRASACLRSRTLGVAQGCHVAAPLGRTVVAREQQWAKRKCARKEDRSQSTCVEQRRPTSRAARPARNVAQPLEIPCRLSAADRAVPAPQLPIGPAIADGYNPLGKLEQSALSCSGRPPWQP